MAEARSDFLKGGEPRHVPYADSVRVVDAASGKSPPRVMGLIVPLMLGAALGAICYLATGQSLGLFFGPILLVTFLCPGLALAEHDIMRRLLSCALLSVGIAVVWVIVRHVSAVEWLGCSAVLFAYVIALGGVASLLERMVTKVTTPANLLGPVFAASVTTFLAFVWLTWPIWLCPFLTGPHAQHWVNLLTPAHPLMAMNMVVFEPFNFWDRYPLAYQQLTILNQDLLYTLPKSILPMVSLHAGIGVFGFGLWWFRTTALERASRPDAIAR